MYSNYPMPGILLPAVVSEIEKIQSLLLKSIPSNGVSKQINSLFYHNLVSVKIKVFKETMELQIIFLILPKIAGHSIATSSLSPLLVPPHSLGP